MDRRTMWLSSVGIGAAGAYLLDPVSGGRRRARMRDLCALSAHQIRKGAGKVRRDLRNRMYGTVATTGRWFRREHPVDAIMVERVRAALGRVVSHPHPVTVQARGSTITLSGPILKAEVPTLLSEVRAVPGVRNIENRLEPHEQPENIPSLQGGPLRRPLPRRLDIRQRNWAPATRVLVGGTALAAVGFGATSRGRIGVLLAVTGATAFARAATNLELQRLLGIGASRRAVDLQKTITVEVPVEQVFAYWDRFENFPTFMTHVREISSTRDPRQWHWTVEGPAGVTIEFDALVTERIPNRLLAWKTAPGSPIGHAGVVRFESAGPRATRVHIRMSYNPPGGAVTHGVLALFGADAKRRIDDDLVRMKEFLETGRPPHDAAMGEGVTPPRMTPSQP